MSKDILLEENESTENMLSMNYLKPGEAVFRETPGGFAALTVGGKDYGHVNIIRAFPFSAADKYLSVRLPDDKQEEIGIIESLDDFDARTVELIEKQFKIRYFMPKITKIFSIKEEYGYTYWTVMTDKGKCRFASSSGSAGAVIQLGTRVIIKDSNENRYEIEDMTKLSVSEMKKLDLYL